MIALSAKLMFHVLALINVFFRAPKIRPFIKMAVERRLRMITPYIDKWPQVGILNCNHEDRISF